MTDTGNTLKEILTIQRKIVENQERDFAYRRKVLRIGIALAVVLFVLQLTRIWWP